VSAVADASPLIALPLLVDVEAAGFWIGEDVRASALGAVGE
jgi:hypothetical protein